MNITQDLEWYALVQDRAYSNMETGDVDIFYEFFGPDGIEELYGKNIAKHWTQRLRLAIQVENHEKVGKMVCELIHKLYEKHAELAMLDEEWSYSKEYEDTGVTDR